jgi:hypothetical protein
MESVLGSCVVRYGFFVSLGVFRCLFKKKLEDQILGSTAADTDCSVDED